MRSLYDNVKVYSAVRPQTVYGTGTPTAASVDVIDTMGYTTGMFNVAVGTPTGTTAAITLTLDAQVYECATSNGTFTAVSGAAITQITGTHKSAQIRVEGLGTSRQRYLKLVMTPSVSPSASTIVLPIQATCLLGRGYQGPVDNSVAGA